MVVVLYEWLWCRVLNLNEWLWCCTLYLNKWLWCCDLYLNMWLWCCVLDLNELLWFCNLYLNEWLWCRVLRVPAHWIRYAPTVLLDGCYAFIALIILFLGLFYQGTLTEYLSRNPLTNSGVKLIKIDGLTEPMV